MNKRIKKLLASSSSMEGLEQEHLVYYQITQGLNQERREEDRYHLEFFPHRHIIEISKVKVIFEKSVLSMGTSPRWVNSENIMFFADEVHRVSWLKEMGFSNEWIENNLLQTEAQIIPFPIPIPIQPVSLPPASAATGFSQQPLAGGMKTQLGL